MNSVIAKLLNIMDDLQALLTRKSKKIGHEPTPQKRRNPGQGNTHNHNKGESKKRRLMAQKSPANQSGLGEKKIMAPKVTIWIQEDKYEKQYAESMNYLNSKYHDQPTRLKNVTLTEAEQLLISTHGTLKSGTLPTTPIGKLVI